MADLTEEQLKELMDKTLAEWAQKGKLVEAGWAAYAAVNLRGAPEIQRTEMRKTFMFGAQYLFVTVMRILDSGTEPTEKDMRNMELIDNELEAFRLEMTGMDGSHH